MRYQTLLAIGLLACAPAAVLADADTELRAMEEQRRTAIQAQDFAILEKIYAKEFIAAAGNGQMIDRATLFGVFKRNDPALSFTTDEIRIVSSGDTAVFFGRLTARTPAGGTAFASRFSHVFVRRNGTWVCIAGQSTPLPGQG